MEQAVIVAVHVQVGQKVCKGQILADIETDKAAMQIESPADGIIRAVLVEPPVTLPVDTPLFVLSEDGRPIDPERLEKLKQQVQTARDRVLEPAAAPAQTISSQYLPEIPPHIRPQEAVEAFQTSNAVAPAQFKPGKKVPFTRWQAVVAQRMLLSKRQIPCFYLNLQADMTELTQLRDTLKKQGGNLSYNDFLLKAAAVSLRRYPI